MPAAVPYKEDDTLKTLDDKAPGNEDGDEDEDDDDDSDDEKTSP
jgi:hypothetical protein